MGIFVDDCNELIWKFIIITVVVIQIVLSLGLPKVSLMIVLTFETAAHTHNTRKLIGKHLRQSLFPVKVIFALTSFTKNEVLTECQRII